MSDKRKIQHEGIIALINYSTLCAKQCDVLKGHDDKITNAEEQCLRILVSARAISIKKDISQNQQSEYKIILESLSANELQMQFLILLLNKII